MTNKLHYTFTGTLAANLNDPCIRNMALSGILVNATTREMYVRTKVTNPVTIGDFTLLNSGGSGGIDRYVTSGTYITASKTLQLTRSDGATVNIDLTAVSGGTSSDFFDNSGTNFISTTQTAAIKELNTSRPFGKIGGTQAQSTTNKQLLINDNIYHIGKVQLGINQSVTNDISLLRVHGALNAGISNVLETSATAQSYAVGGNGNDISNATHPTNPFLSGSGTIGGGTNTISAYNSLIAHSSSVTVSGGNHFALHSTLSNITNTGNTLINSSNVIINGINNYVWRTKNTDINGSNNTIFKADSLDDFINSNNNTILDVQFSTINAADGNIILKAIDSIISGDSNLVWGEGIRLQVAGVAAGNTIVLGRNVAAVAANNSFIWSASEAGVDPNNDPEISDDGCFVLLDASPQDYFQTAATNEFVARFSGGFRLRTNEAGTVGVDLAANGSSWSAVSSILTKDVVSDNINIDNLVDKLKDVAFKVYKYKDDKTGTHFLSTSAEEWHELMGGITTPEFLNTRQGILPGIRINDQINLALLLIQDLYRKIGENG